MSIGLGIISNLSIPNLILLIDSDSYRFPVLIPIRCGLKKIKHLDMKCICSVSLFAKHLIAAEYHEQKSAGHIKTGLDEVQFV